MDCFYPVCVASDAILTTNSFDFCRGRKLSELNIPARPKLRPEALRRFLDSVNATSSENVHFAASKANSENGVQPSTSIAEGKDSASVLSGSKNGSRVQSQPSPAPSHAKPDIPGSVQSPRLSAKATFPALEGRSDAQTPESAPSTSTPDVSKRHGAEPTETEQNAVPTPPSVVEGRLAQETTGEKTRADGEGVSSLAPEPMDIDDATIKGSAQDGGRLSIRPPTGDSTKAPDALSSQGSTPAQSATTPAVHEAASADTSPENEGSQYVEPEDEKAEPPKALAIDNGVSAGGDSGDGTTQDEDQGGTDALGGAVNGVEAQLLQESAAARLSKMDAKPEGPSTLEIPTISHGRSARGSPAAPISPQESVAPAKDVQPKASPAASGTQAPVEAVPVNQEPTPADSMDLDGQVPRVSSQTTTTTTEARHANDSELSGLSSQVPHSSDQAVSATSPAIAERAVTRISSGALRQKSVSELLGAVPRATSTGADGVAGDKPEILSQTVPAPGLKPDGRDARRRSIPTVVFGKPPKQGKKQTDASIVARRQKPGQLPTDDYFTPLFIDGFTRQSKWMKPIEQLLHHAHKTISTSDQYLSLLDHQACRILRRVYHLQQHDKWSLRQPMRCPEPTRPPSHRDALLQEMKWMRTDFREERKWKRAVARNLAAACAEWVESSPEERKLLQVNAVIPPRTSGLDVTMTSPDADAVEYATPEQIHSDSSMAIGDQSLEQSQLIETVAPSAIFAMQDNEVVFGLQRSQASDRLLDELPLYGSPLKVPKFDLTGPEYDPDANWKRPALPLSKYVEGQMVLKTEEPPRKRTRYDYSEEDDGEEGQVVFGGQPSRTEKAVRGNPDVALFKPEMKAIRDRLHAGHQFRPPTEYQMPPQSFYESRPASQWTWGEDDELKSLVREFSYNWSLISSVISTKSIFASGAERRTPWECFERWINLEGLPNDMSKTQYFKTYHNRIETAQRMIKQQNEAAAAQQVGPNGAVVPYTRRRPTTTMRVDRRRNVKHLTLLDAMRKLAKKRETTATKAQHAASLATMRKNNDAQRQPGPTTKTPRDYSLMRWERDQQLAEKMAQYAQRQQEAMQKRVRFFIYLFICFFFGGGRGGVWVCGGVASVQLFWSSIPS